MDSILFNGDTIHNQNCIKRQSFAKSYYFFILVCDVIVANQELLDR